ncbi:MAG: bifunctional folylpolyglutamate synthase/dihydrofolate synthase, partial [Spirochaetales bacterium]
ISRPGTFKKSNPAALYNTAKGIAKETEVVLKEEAKDAVDYALRNTKDGDSILVCGSFYLAGEIKEVICH